MAVVTLVQRYVSFQHPDETTSYTVSVTVNPFMPPGRALCYGSFGGAVQMQGCPGWMALLLPQRRLTRPNTTERCTPGTAVCVEELFVPDADEYDLPDDVKDALRQAYS